MYGLLRKCRQALCNQWEQGKVIKLTSLLGWCGTAMMQLNFVVLVVVVVVVALNNSIKRIKHSSYAVYMKLPSRRQQMRVAGAPPQPQPLLSSARSCWSCSDLCPPHQTPWRRHSQHQLTDRATVGSCWWQTQTIPVRGVEDIICWMQTLKLKCPCISKFRKTFRGYTVFRETERTFVNEAKFKVRLLRASIYRN